MDLERTKRLFEELIKKYHKSETYGILFYSTDKIRDFAALDREIKRYQERLSEAIGGATTINIQSIKPIRISSGENDLPKVVL